MKNICIYASDLATFIGINKYQKLSEMILKLWQKNYPIDYENAISNIKIKHNVEIVSKETDTQCLKRIQDESSVDVSSKIQECLSMKDTSKLLKNRAEILKEINMNKNIDEDAKKEFKTSLESMTNKVFGTINEKSVIERYTELTNKNVDTSSKFINRKLCTYKNVIWKLGGKIDGITDDKIVVEVKNRIYKLFYEMRDYERPQIQTYMYILGLDKGHLVECYKKNGEMQLNIIEEDFDDEYWNEVILSRLNNFIKLFHVFLENKELQEYVLVGDDDKEETLSKFLQ